MDESSPHVELFCRLQFLVAMTSEKLPGSELAVLVRLALGQNVSAREMNLTRQGFKRAMDALSVKKLIYRDAVQVEIHPEVCAKYGFSPVEGVGPGKDLLRMLAGELLPSKSVRKDLYLHNANGEPASEEDLSVLLAKLLHAAVYVASLRGRTSEHDVRSKYAPPHGMSRALQMRGLASIVASFLDGGVGESWSGNLSQELSKAVKTTHAGYPSVLDPHRLLDWFRSYLLNLKNGDFAALTRTVFLNDKPGSKAAPATKNVAAETVGRRPEVQRPSMQPTPAVANLTKASPNPTQVPAVAVQKQSKSPSMSTPTRPARPSPASLPDAPISAATAQVSSTDAPPSSKRTAPSLLVARTSSADDVFSANNPDKMG